MLAQHPEKVERKVEKSSDRTAVSIFLRYLLHAPISQQRMHYDPTSGTVRYETAAQPPA
jgi:hypothetical protein